LGNGDSIVDASTKDTDSLSAEILGALDSTLKITNVENLSLNAMAGTVTVDATNITGVKSLTHTGVGGLSLSNWSNAAATLDLNGTASNVTVAYTGASVSGDADGIGVNLTGTTGGTVTLTGAVEAVRVDAKTKSSLDNVAASSATALLLNGEVTIGSATTQLATNYALIDGRTTTKSTLFSLGGAGNTILTGAGDDKVTIYTNGLAASNLVGMGAGNDTLELRGTTNAAATLNGIENITLKTAASSIDLKNADTASKLVFEGGGAITVTNAKAGTTLSSTTAAAAAVSFGFRDTESATSLNLDLKEGATGAITLTNVETATITASKAITGAPGIALDQTAGGTVVAKSLTVDAATAAAALDLGAITLANKLETLTLNATKSSVTTGAFAAADSLKTLSLNATAAGVTIGALGGATALDSIVLNSATGGGAITTDTIGVASAAGISTINITANGGAVTTGVITNTGGGVGKVTLTGTENITTAITVTGTTNKVATVDASGAVGGNISITLIDALAATASGTTVTLGNAATSKTNTVVLTGTDGKNVVTGGNGTDSVLGGTGADSLIGAGGADTLSGAAGNDTILGGTGNDSITGGTGADLMTGGTGVDTYVYAAGDSITASATTIASGTATIFDAGETITFANGVDIITDFTAGTGGDVFDGANAALPTAGLSVVAGATTGYAAATTYRFSGTWDSSAGVFTLAAAGTGTDTLLLEGLGTAPNVNVNYVVLVGVVDTNLVAANFA
jgi:hypothetical protein